MKSFMLSCALMMSLVVADWAMCDDSNETTTSSRLNANKVDLQGLDLTSLVAIRTQHPLQICAKDRRELVKPKANAERATCLLQIRFPKSQKIHQGSGFIVAKHLVLTAGHCVYSKGDGGWAEWIRVVPGSSKLADEPPFGAYIGSKVFSVSGWTDKQASEYDYGAIVVDDDAMSAKVNATIGILALTDERLKQSKFLILGYPGEKSPQGSQWRSVPSKQLEEVLPLRVKHEIDSTAGTSGSPVLDGSSAIAIHSDGGCPNAATRLTEARRDKVLNEWAK
jgi:glutamyl endopeptidase